MEKVTVTDVYDAALEIIRSQSKATNWAKNYAEAALSMTGEELRVQCLYVLNNITHWREPAAKTVRQTLKSYVAKKGG
jgi:hypothetical protein